MKEQIVPVEVVEKDHKLDGAATKTTEALAKHRHHWILDETNPNRVTMGAYARAVGRNLATIRNHARGYELWVAHGAGPMGLTECIERARMGAEKTEVVEAVAEANAIGFKQATKAYAPEINRVRSAVERKVEKQPDITPEEKQEYTKKIAKTYAISRQAERERVARRKKNKTFRYINIEGELAQARRCVSRVLDEARGAEGDFNDDEIELLTRSFDSLVAAINVARMAVLDSINVDWDIEMTKLQEMK
jgi:hypothetical protein